MYILRCYAIVVLDFLEGHAPGKGADNNVHGHARATDDWLAVVHCRINGNAIGDHPQTERLHLGDRLATRLPISKHAW